jgi:AAA-like domain/TIR domain
MSGKVFISYSHKDRDWLEKFQTMLKPLMSGNSLIFWDDTKLTSGSKWREELQRQLVLADVALLLVSKNFLASDFIVNNELPVLLNSAEQKGLSVIWVAISASLYKVTEIAKYQAAYDPGVPLNALDPADLDQALVEICDKIMDSLNLKTPIAQEAIIASNGIAVKKEGKGAKLPYEPPKVSSARSERFPPLKIAILYKRNVSPDDVILDLLEKYFVSRGHSVFIDRHLSIGVQWAEAIERELKSSDVVIPLLSATSVTSEMLNFELETAHVEAQKSGKPRILPLRVGFQGALPGPLGSMLDPLQYALWNGPDDNERVLIQLESSIRQPVVMRPDPPGGVVPIDSKFYVVRDVDRKLLQAIAHKDSIILIKGARQTGKTSLLARGLLEAKKMEYKVIVTDLQKLNTSSLENIGSFYLALGAIIADQLGIKIYPKDVWNASLSPNLNFEGYMKNVVLDVVPQPIAWGMDEVDRLFTTDFGSEVFGLFRSWFNERAFVETPLARMSLVIVYALEAHLFITDPYQSPFNVGTKLEMKDFAREQVEDLNMRYGNPLSDGRCFQQFYEKLGGHPYLVRKGLHELTSGNIAFDDLIRTADSDEGPFGDHLRRILVMLGRNEELWKSIKEILGSGKCSSVESFYRLRTSGIASGDTESQVRFRCRIYETYLQRHLPI